MGKERVGSSKGFLLIVSGEYADCQRRNRHHLFNFIQTIPRYSPFPPDGSIFPGWFNRSRMVQSFPDGSIAPGWFNRFLSRNDIAIRVVTTKAQQQPTEYCEITMMG